MPKSSSLASPADPHGIAGLLHQQWMQQAGDQPHNELKPDPARLAFEVHLLRHRVTELEQTIKGLAQHVGYSCDPGGG